MSLMTIAPSSGTSTNSSGATSLTKVVLACCLSNGDSTASSVHPFQLIAMGSDCSYEYCVVLDAQSVTVEERSVGVYGCPSAMYTFALQARRLFRNACSSRSRFLISLSSSRLLCCIFFLFLRDGSGSKLRSRSFRACLLRRACRYVTQLARPFSKISFSCRSLARSTAHPL